MSAQSPAPAARFDVASIKVASPADRPGRMGGAIEIGPNTLTARSATLQELVAAAYSVETYQVVGGPAWVETARFAVEAKAGQRSSRDQLMLMLRTVLSERFNLVARNETREMAVYALTVAKGGIQFKSASQSTERAPVDQFGRNADMAWLAKYLSRFGADRPVVDRTGLTGRFDLNLDMGKVMAAAAEVSGGTPETAKIFEATVEAIGDLGLTLKPAKAKLQVIAVDRAERPSGN